MYSAKDIAKWFIVHNRLVMLDADADYISNLKLQKLLYYAQGAVLAIKGKPLFREKINAWKHGPVVKEVYDEYKDYEWRGIDGDITLDLSTISDDVQDILTQVYETFGQYSAWKLRNMTHEESPWMETERNQEIPTKKIGEYFAAHYLES